MNAQIAVSLMTQGVFVRLFLEEISIWVDNLNKDYIFLSRWALSNPLRTWTERKLEEVPICSLHRLGHPSSPALGHQLLTLRTSDWAWNWLWLPQFSGLRGFGLEWRHQLSWRSSLWAADQGLLSLHKPMSHPFIINLFLCICADILSVLFLLKNPD